MKLAGWGRYNAQDTALAAPRDLAALRQMLASGQSVIARGNGRAYGDSAVGPEVTISTRHLTRMISFDDRTGQLVAEAGVILGDVITAFLPRGWFPLVTPGSKFVTLGGMVAADVHGKNHHKDGSFRTCVDWVEVMGADGEVTRASPTDNSGLFEHTLGGMGLTGIITRVAIRLRPVETGWIRQRTVPAPNLGAAIAAFEASQDVTYSVAWIDCLGRGASLGRSLVMLGEHATLSELPRPRQRRPYQTPVKTKKTVPFDFPSFALNALTVQAFNALYYRKGAANTAPQLIDWDSYFYPLDAILGWNKIYGRRGFVQFQCVLPLAASEAGLTELLKATSRAGAGSFLAVLKRFGQQDSAFSFPMEGYTLALDFPVSQATLRLLKRLDAITVDHGGRFYLAKDARMAQTTQRASDDRTEAFLAARAAEGWSGHFRSSQSERLSL